VTIANHHSYSAARSVQVTEALRTFQEEIVRVGREPGSQQRAFSMTASRPIETCHAHSACRAGKHVLSLKVPWTETA
jgi:hypothetical protein